MVVGAAGCELLTDVPLDDRLLMTDDDHRRPQAHPRDGARPRPRRVRARARGHETARPQGLGGRCPDPARGHRRDRPRGRARPGPGGDVGPCQPAPIGDTGDALELAIVKSPIVGTFYRASAPGAPSFVEVGTVVKKGQVLCIIEAMKLMNEIESEYRRGDRRDLRRERPAGAVRRAAVRHQGAVSMFKKHPDRQPRRDRAARALRVQGTGHQHRGRVLRGRREPASRAFRRRGRVHRTGPQRRQLPQRARDHQRGRDHRRRGHPPGLRLPLGERVPGGGLRGLPHPVHRARAARDSPDGGQGPRAPHDEEGRCARSCQAATAPSRAKSSALKIARDLGLSRHRQGGGRRRRARHAHRPQRGRSVDGAPNGAARGPGGLRRG